MMWRRLCVIVCALALIAPLWLSSPAFGDPAGSGTSIDAVEGTPFSVGVGTFTDPIGMPSGFVVQAFGDVLGRAPTDTELATGLAFLSSHTHGELAASLLASSEYRGDLIAGWYRSLLGRVPSATETAYWLGVFTADADLIAAIAGSSEYYALAGSTDAGFVARVYQDLLGRAASTSELSAGVVALGSETRTDFASALLATPEARERTVSSIYMRYLGRQPSGSELSYWVASPASDEDIAAALIGSSEYEQAVPAELGAHALVTIDWGDATSSPGTVAPNPAGGFNVSGSHTYSDEGTYPIAVAIVDELGRTTTLKATAVVHDAPITLAGVGLQAEKKQSFTAVIATGSDTNATAPTSDLSATVNWGDGTQTNANVAHSVAGGGFTISGSHVYSKQGTYQVTVQVDDIGGSTAAATATATITNKNGKITKPGRSSCMAVRCS